MQIKTFKRSLSWVLSFLAFYYILLTYHILNIVLPSVGLCIYSSLLYLPWFVFYFNLLVGSSPMLLFYLILTLFDYYLLRVCFFFIYFLFSFYFFFGKFISCTPIPIISQVLSLPLSLPLSLTKGIKIR